MPEDPLAIANYFLDLAVTDAQPLDPMKIQKLVYYAHGWNLAAHNEPLINQPVEAWPYGPVIPSVYHAFKAYGRSAIKRKADLDANGNYSQLDPSVDRALLNEVWQSYGALSGVQLSNATHQPGSPWDLVWNGSNGHRKQVIPDGIIKDYFARQLSA